MAIITLSHTLLHYVVTKSTICLPEKRWSDYSTECLKDDRERTDYTATQP